MYLENVKCNRRKGAKKAAAKRRERQTKSRQTSDMSDDVCGTCYCEEPPRTEDNGDDDDDDDDDAQVIEWVACGSCAKWHHILCVQVTNLS